jgi:hypothetical protein
MSPFVRRGDIILKKPQIYLNPNRTWLECSLHGPLQNAYFFFMSIGNQRWPPRQGIALA